MTLDEYLTQAGKSPADFARESGLDKGTVSRLRRGENRPSWRTIDLIAGITNGAVNAADWPKPQTNDIEEAEPASVNSGGL